MTSRKSETRSAGEEDFSSRLMEELREKLLACMQCGTCTGSCGSSFAMDLTPRQLWRLVQLGEKREIFKSRTFYLCSACYFCTLRCPRGLPLTEAMSALKRIAAAEGIKRYKQSANFYKAFMDTVRRYGRLREMEFMNRYFFSMKNPVLPMGYASLGLKLMKKGKVSPEIPKFLGEGRFDKLFRKVDELEKRP
ncbi:MAG: 4Fe-4S dicluster domain-containing protein [Deltaproteobacteria bacterium]|nr:4Fe-4S dicluster domain-containing protein [Deltaproteobacteria bacterium]MBW2016292.1 4Fe-4S dicluster domain-containing protein [Deltaproteobacteria bacterium]MBW2129258.1 4Fe-4S dicluster domain-containing protein [Deltaproteobacteria bacterium]MBW2304349.1 4Fe-4S dicluster domain-containing protein [Deltaproteobacteria bacterium]